MSYGIGGGIERVPRTATMSESMAASTQTDYAAQVSRLAQSTQSLNSAIEQLGRRIEPFMRGPQPTEAIKETREIGPKTQVGTQIYEMSLSVEHATRVVYDLLDRLEI